MNQLEKDFQKYYHSYLNFAYHHQLHDQNTVQKLKHANIMLVIQHIYTKTQHLTNLSEYFNQKFPDFIYVEGCDAFQIDCDDKWYSLNEECKKKIVRFWYALTSLSHQYMNFLNNIVSSSTQPHIKHD